MNKPTLSNGRMLNIHKKVLIFFLEYHCLSVGVTKSGKIQS